MALSMRLLAIVSVLVLAVAQAALAEDGRALLNSQAEQSLQSNDLSAAREILLKALAEVQKDVTAKQDPGVNKLFASVNAWKQAYETERKKEQEEYVRKGQEEWPRRQAELKREAEEREARWKAAKAKGKSVEQFGKEEQQRNGPQNLAKFQSQLSTNSQKVDSDIKRTEQHKELMSAAACKQMRGATDTDALAYDSAAKKDEELLQTLQPMKALYTHKDPKEFLVAGMTPKAESTFASAFSTPLSQVTELKGGGFSWLGYSVWVRFKASGKVTLKDQSKFQKVSPNSFTGVFVSVCKEDKPALIEKASLECFRASTNGTQPAEQVLLINKKRGLYWYRAQGGS